MKIAILSPGESLKRFNPAWIIDNKYDRIIGINRVVSKFKCDWWSALDILTCQNINPVGEPALFTIQTTATRLTGFNCILTHEELVQHGGAYVPDDIEWSKFSATAALILANQLRGSRPKDRNDVIECWGCDMKGSKDWDGTNTLYTRTPERWERERVIWEKIVNFLEKNINVKVVSFSKGREF